MIVAEGNLGCIGHPLHGDELLHTAPALHGSAFDDGAGAQASRGNVERLAKTVDQERPGCLFVLLRLRIAPGTPPALYGTGFETDARVVVTQDQLLRRGNGSDSYLLFVRCGDLLGRQQRADKRRTTPAPERAVGGEPASVRAFSHHDLQRESLRDRRAPALVRPPATHFARRRAGADVNFTHGQLGRVAVGNNGRLGNERDAFGGPIPDLAFRVPAPAHDRPAREPRTCQAAARPNLCRVTNTWDGSWRVPSPVRVRQPFVQLAPTPNRGIRSPRTGENVPRRKLDGVGDALDHNGIRDRVPPAVICLRTGPVGGAPAPDRAVLTPRTRVPIPRRQLDGVGEIEDQIGLRPRLRVRLQVAREPICRPRVQCNAVPPLTVLPRSPTAR